MGAPFLHAMGITKSAGFCIRLATFRRFFFSKKRIRDRVRTGGMWARAAKEREEEEEEEREEDSKGGPGEERDKEKS